MVSQFENAALAVDEAEANGSENPNLLDPGSTPEKLRTFHYGIAVPCPTRVMTRETGLALSGLAKPMFGQPVPISPDSLEVGEARNQCVEMAREMGVRWLFFVDYDVAPPPNALTKLLSLKVPIASGVYHLKSVPSYPLIYVKGWEGAFEDYEYGDLVKADGCGMGCTLIDMKVFDDIKPPYFKTVAGYSEKNTNAILPHLTEDIYFCEKARAAGYDIIVDTAIQAMHVDYHTGIIYHYVNNENGGRGTPGWTYRRGSQYLTEVVADASHPGAHWADLKPPPKRDKKDAPKMIDLGSGPMPETGYLGIDKFAAGPNVIEGDIEDLSWFTKEHGLVDKIRAHHSLEHVSHRSIPRTFRSWVRALAPGGELVVHVPDGEYHMNAILERIKNGEDQDPQCDWLNYTIYGLQIGEGQEHKTLFTKNRLEQLAKSQGLKSVKVERKVWEGNDSKIPTTAELILTGKRGK